MSTVFRVGLASAVLNLDTLSITVIDGERSYKYFLQSDQYWGQILKSTVSRTVSNGDGSVIYCVQNSQKWGQILKIFHTNV
jgi:hypothetical protein